jgi:ABC-type multidrug transport system ATPase subunit
MRPIVTRPDAICYGSRVPQPLFSADRARIDVGGVPALDGLTLATTGEKVLVVGAPRALFEAAVGMRHVAHGALLVSGQNPRAAVVAGLVAGAPDEPRVPPRWSARAYVAWSARLAGHSRRTAGGLADEALARLRLQKFADAHLAKATPLARRATIVAAAIATGARAVFLADPIAGLDDRAARSFAHILVAALEDRAWAVFAPRLELGSPLALHADEALVVAGSRVASQGAPAEVAARDRTYAVRLHGERAAFASRASERGAKVVLPDDGNAAAPLTVQLGNLSTHDIFAIAEESQTVIVEMVPLSRAFA